jgi:hypothetical protein
MLVNQYYISRHARMHYSVKNVIKFDCNGMQLQSESCSQGHHWALPNGANVLNVSDNVLNLFCVLENKNIKL